MQYKIDEIFSSWQGEGAHCGQSALFLRLCGCPIRCKWCDSKRTWDSYSIKLCENGILKEIKNLENYKNANFLVITGGEPAIWDLEPICKVLRENLKINLHIETSGAFEIKGKLDWITLSPKKNKLPLDVNIEKASEIKIVLETPEDFEFWQNAFPKIMQKDIVHLVPEYSRRKDKQLLEFINEKASSSKNIRAALQMHKYFMAR